MKAGNLLRDVRIDLRARPTGGKKMEKTGLTAVVTWGGPSLNEPPWLPLKKQASDVATALAISPPVRPTAASRAAYDRRKYRKATILVAFRKNHFIHVSENENQKKT